MENESNQLAIATPKKEISTPIMADFADALYYPLLQIGYKNDIM